jgi:hypothetical protein
MLLLLTYKSPDTKIYNFLKSKHGLSIDVKTFKKTEYKETKPPINTIKKLDECLPGIANLFQKMWTDSVSGNERHEWEEMLNAFHLGAAPDEYLFFPYFQQNLRELIAIEKAIRHKIEETLQNSENAMTVLEIAQIYMNQPYVKYILSKEEFTRLCTTQSDNEVEGILFLVMIRTILYCTACIDAEFTFNNKMEYCPAIIDLLPKYEKKELQTSTRQLFEYWKKTTGTYTAMQTIRSESQKRKLNQWKCRNKIAKDDEIRKLISKIYPDIEKDHPLGTNLGVIYYRIANFLDNLHDALLSAKNNGGDDLFKTDNGKLAEAKVIEWMTESYKRFYDDTYKELTLAKGIIP